jgi:hypothetical protein
MSQSPVVDPVVAYVSCSKLSSVSSMGWMALAVPDIIPSKIDTSEITNKLFILKI